MGALSSGDFIVALLTLRVSLSFTAVAGADAPVMAEAAAFWIDDMVSGHLLRYP